MTIGQVMNDLCSGPSSRPVCTQKIFWGVVYYSLLELCRKIFQALDIRVALACI